MVEVVLIVLVVLAVVYIAKNGVKLAFSMLALGAVLAACRYFGLI